MRPPSTAWILTTSHLHRRQLENCRSKINSFRLILSKKSPFFVTIHLVFVIFMLLDYTCSFHNSLNCYFRTHFNEKWLDLIYFFKMKKHFPDLQNHIAPKQWTVFWQHTANRWCCAKRSIIIVRASFQQDRARLIRLRNELCSDSFHAVLAWSCGRAKWQCCTATVTVVVYNSCIAVQSGMPGQNNDFINWFSESQI